MKKRALNKDFLMEVKNSMNRFLSILLIATLGVAFFSGLQSSAPDMRITEDAYFDESNLMDIRVISTLGLTGDDLEAISDVDGVEAVEGSYMEDVYCDDGETETVLRVESFTDSMNIVSVTEGSLPSNAGECFLDAYYAESRDYHPGDKLEIMVSDEENTYLKRQTFTIAGIGYSPCYISLTRGSTSLGTGSLSGFIYVLPEDFDTDVYSIAYVQVEGAKDELAYTDAYDDLIEEVLGRIEDIADVRAEVRYKEVTEEAQAEIDDAREEVEDGKATLEDAKAALEQVKASVLMQIEGVQAQIEEYEQEIADAEQEIADAEQQIADAEAELAALSYPAWYVYDRSSLPDNAGYGENADRIASIAQVFPVLFFLIAALISLTTMSRMVEEERTQIGTLKALGYGRFDIARKYLEYAFLATLIGSVLGIALGEKIIPWIIVNAYGIMYLYVPEILVPYNLPIGIIASAAAMVCTIGAAFYSCYHSLSTVPAELMRPPSPRQGKRVFLEHIPIIWNRLNFNWKSTVRNLLRYKSRFFMTIFGIGGCMGLLLVGFGLRDSIMDIGVLQYNEIQTFEAMVVLDTEASDEAIDELEQTIANDSRITESKYFYMQNLNIAQRDSSGSGKQWTIYVYVPDNLDNIEDFLTFRSRTSGEEYELNDDGAIITEKIAREFGLSVGDTISLNKDDDTIVEVPISAVCENYLTHYIYLTPALYEETFGEEMVPNCIFFCSDEEQDVLNQIGARLLSCDAAINITYMSALASEIEDMLGALDLVILVLIVSAGLLAFVVLYNLNNININERKRELATLKVLGFFDREVSAYIFRENVLLTVLGAIAGCLIGKVMHGFIVTTVEVDSTMFGRTIYPVSYVYGILFTFAFAVIVNFWMHFKMKKIDMIESLKSIE